MTSEIMISTKKTVSPSVTSPLKEKKTSTLEKEQIMEATFRSHITMDLSMTLTNTVVL